MPETRANRSNPLLGQGFGVKIHSYRCQIIVATMRSNRVVSRANAGGRLSNTDDWCRNFLQNRQMYDRRWAAAQLPPHAANTLAPADD